VPADTLGFPAPFPGAAPVRLPVLRADATALALATQPFVPPKNGLSMCAGATLAAATPRLFLANALRGCFAAGRPEFLALPLRPPLDVVWQEEGDISGIAVFARKGEPLVRWRNAFGSFQLTFIYEFLAANARASDSAAGFDCELPVALHDGKPLALVSHRSGRKSRTEFRRRARAGRWSWWEARTTYPRFHQIRLHAAECGLRIAGETLYADGGEITAGAFLPRRRPTKGVVRPLHTGVCLWLARVETAAAEIAGWGAPLQAPEPRWAQVLRKRLPGEGVGILPLPE
jgi:hypothetical protein